MLSFTSNSNYKTKVFILLIISIILYTAVNVGALLFNKLYYSQLESKNVYKRDVDGMFHMMTKKYPLYSPSSLDIIFVGNSTTKVQVHSTIFQALKMRVFNYSLLGYTIYQYPRMVSNAIKEKPKIIVISIKEPELYVPMTYLYNNYYHQLDINLSSLIFLSRYLNNRDDYVFFKKLTVSYLAEKNFFKLHGFNVIEGINSVYHKYGKPDFAETNHINALPLSICIFPHTPLSSFDDCDNGDIALVGKESTYNPTPDPETYNHPKANLNYALVNMYNALIDEIKKAGIQPVVVFIPEFSHHVYESDLPSKVIHADIIQLSNLPIPSDGWYNREHLNSKGRDIYSKELAKMLTPFVSRNA
jgi:hypothetical protein